MSAEAKKRSVGKGKRDKDVSLTLVRRGVMKSFRFKGLTGSWVIHFFLPLPVFLAADFLEEVGEAIGGENLSGEERAAIFS